MVADSAGKAGHEAGAQVLIRYQGSPQHASQGARVACKRLSLAAIAARAARQAHLQHNQVHSRVTASRRGGLCEPQGSRSPCPQTDSRGTPREHALLTHVLHKGSWGQESAFAGAGCPSQSRMHNAVYNTMFVEGLQRMLHHASRFHVVQLPVYSVPILCVVAGISFPEEPSESCRAVKRNDLISF